MLIICGNQIPAVCLYCQNKQTMKNISNVKVLLKVCRYQIKVFNLYHNEIETTYLKSGGLIKQDKIG